MSVQSDAFRDPAASAGLQSDDGVLSRGAIASETSAKDAMYAQLKMAHRTLPECHDTGCHGVHERGDVTHNLNPVGL
jgi:hypothetical protein